jgi:hypothetical protein
VALPPAQVQHRRRSPEELPLPGEEEPECPGLQSRWVNQLLNEPNSLPNPLLPHVSRLLAVLSLPVSSYLPEGLSHHGVKPLLANSGLKVIPALGELMLPPCGLKPSLGLIQVHLMLCWGSPV